MSLTAGKYFSWQRGAPLTEADSCSWEEWETDPKSAEFSCLANGILVFVPADSIEDLDDYRQGAYSLEPESNPRFRAERMKCLFDLLEQVFDGGKAAPQVLDLGCGPGLLAVQVQRRYPDVVLTGLDTSVTALEKAKELLPAADLVLADGFSPPFSPGFFDAVFCCNVLEHVQDPVGLISSISRVLKPGGALILSTPSRYRFDSLIRVVTGRRVRLMSQDHVTEYSVGQIEDFLRFCDLRLSRIHGRFRLPNRWTAKNLVSHAVLKPFLRVWKRVSGSHHVLSSTAFFLAIKPRDSVLLGDSARIDSQS